MMLNRSASFQDQLRIIIDDDKYKHVQNTVKKDKYIELSHSNTHSVSSSVCSREMSVSSSIDIIKTQHVDYRGFVQNDEENENVEESITCSNQDSEPSLIHSGPITLMGFADKNEIFVHSNNDLKNNNITFLNYMNHSNEK